MEQKYYVFTIESLHFAIIYDLVKPNIFNRKTLSNNLIKESNAENNTKSDIKNRIENNIENNIENDDKDNMIDLIYCIANVRKDNYEIVSLKNSYKLKVDTIIGIKTIKNYEIKWFKNSLIPLNDRIITGVSRRKDGNIFILNDNYQLGPN